MGSVRKDCTLCCGWESIFTSRLKGTFYSDSSQTFLYVVPTREDLISAAMDSSPNNMTEFLHS